METDQLLTDCADVTQITCDGMCSLLTVAFIAADDADDGRAACRISRRNPVDSGGYLDNEDISLKMGPDNYARVDVEFLETERNYDRLLVGPSMEYHGIIFR